MTGSFFRLAPSSRRTKRILIVLAVLYALYAAFAALIGPVIVRRQLLERLSARLHRPVTVGRVRVNPFSITVTVDSLRVADRDGSTLLSWDRFSLNVDLLSIVRREIDLDEIRLERPYARFVIRRDGTMNISDIVDSMSAESARHPSTGPAPVFAVSGLHIADARVDIVDSEPARPFATTVGPWRIDLASFSTRRDNTGQYSFSGSMLTGERFAWVGTFAMDPVRSAGQLTVDSVRFGTYGPFYERNVAFALTSGVWGIHAKYSVDLAPRAQILRMSEGSAYARGFTLVGRAHGDTAVTVDRLEVTGVEADAVANTARVASVALSGANVRVIRSRDSSLNVMRLLATPNDAAPAASARAPNAAPAKPWRWTVGHIGVDSSDLSVLDSVPKRPARFGMSAIHLAVDTISSDSAQLSRVQTALLWEQKGAFTARGTVAMWRRRGDLTYTAKDLPLGPFDAYLPPTANLLIRDGTLLSDGSLHFEWADTLHPELRYAGNVRVDRFATVDIKRHEPFFKFRSLRMPGIT
ncbi:MAG TPA: DUF748 domain-containing protein, partial [Gemmatimonadaceae bacterium]|nr:DUF748 domain-containing protein [Gemmatimonadaceae bacterium]